MKRGKRYQEAAKLRDKTNLYDAPEAVAIVKKAASAKFDETIEAHFKMGLDGRHADQQIRGAVVLPNGTGKKVRVLVFAKGDKAEEAVAAGAEFVGAEELIPKIQNEGWFDFDKVVATPNMMSVVGRLGRVLDKTNIIHGPIGKAAFTEEQLNENFQTLIDAIIKAKPAAAKGQYIRSATLTSTMGPGVKLNPARF